MGKRQTVQIDLVGATGATRRVHIIRYSHINHYLYKLIRLAVFTAGKFTTCSIPRVGYLADEIGKQLRHEAKILLETCRELIGGKMVVLRARLLYLDRPHQRSDATSRFPILVLVDAI